MNLPIAVTRGGFEPHLETARSIRLGTSGRGRSRSACMTIERKIEACGKERPGPRRPNSPLEEEHRPPSVSLIGRPDGEDRQQRKPPSPGGPALERARERKPQEGGRRQSEVPELVSNALGSQAMARRTYGV